MNDTMRTVARYSNLGMTLAVSVALGVFGGRWLDDRWDTAPWLLLIGALFGVSTGMYHFIKSVMTMPSGKPKGDESETG